MSIIKKRGSIALARSLCYQINGAADDSDDMDGSGYGSVDIAEILSGEVVRLREALAQRTWVKLEGEEIRNLWEEATKPDRSTMTMITSFARAIEAKLKDKNCVG